MPCVTSASKHLGRVQTQVWAKCKVTQAVWHDGQLTVHMVVEAGAVDVVMVRTLCQHNLPWI